MKLGIKVGPQKQSFLDLSATNPDCVEVWFNINDFSDYSELFEELKRRSIDVGLHFWGAIDGTIETNISYPDANLIRTTMSLIKKTIDIAAQNNFSYVNIHPGSRAIVSIDFTNHRQLLLSQPVDLETAQTLCRQNALTLHEYSNRHGITFTIESVPPMVSLDWYDNTLRNKPINIYQMPLSTLYMLAGRGLWIANDFCHTAANCIATKPEPIGKLLNKTTRDLLSQTKLIHLGYLLPPYLGTDIHGMLDNPLLETDTAVPNNEQLIGLLRLFKNHECWIIPEPIGDHVKNYFLAKKLVEKALLI